jgi:hypothetical protein
MGSADNSLIYHTRLLRSFALIIIAVRKLSVELCHKAEDRKPCDEPPLDPRGKRCAILRCRPIGLS